MECGKGQQVKPVDYRTREGCEREVLNAVQKDGGFSIFWITENQKRAYAGTRLVNDGRIIRTGGDFPWMKFKLAAKENGK